MVLRMGPRPEDGSNVFWEGVIRIGIKNPQSCVGTLRVRGGSSV